MDFSQSSVAVSSFGDRSLTPTSPSPAAPALSSFLSPPFSSSALKQCRSSSADLDYDPRDDRLGPIKLARTDTFSRHPDLKMQINGNGILGSLVRSNSMVSDGRLGCSPTNSSASDGALLAGDSSLMSEARLMRNDSMVSYPGSAARSVSYHHQPFPFRSSGLPLTMTREMANHFGIHENERAVEVPVFTASQLRELQHHALIFKYLMSGVNVPAELVLPIRNNLAALAGISSGSHHLASLGWGNYHLGYPSTTDPEPGRCRRTDGKKWRCARDVVTDQKYCERHMHRGRHRSRKPAENPTNSSSQAGTGTMASTTNSSSTSSVGLAAAAAAASAARAASTPSTGLRPSITLNVPQQRTVAASTSGLGIKTFSGTTSPNGLSIGSSIHGNQYQIPLQSAGGTPGLSAKDYRYMNGDLGQEQVFFSESSGSIRGLGQESQAMSGLSVLSTVNNSWRSMQSKQQQSFLGGGFGAVEAVNVGRESEGQPLRHFFDDWPRTRDPSTLSWSDVEEDRSNRSSSTTQLSISIPMASSDFTTNAGSPRGKLSLSPLKLSMSRAGEDDPLGVDPTQMGLGVGMGLEMNEDRHRQTNWIPITWEPSVGGPLAEVLQSSTPRECKNSGLNLMTDGWENSPRDSPRMASPTGVLQNATFGAFSDTSTGSSPRAIKIEPGLCDHLRSSEAMAGSIEPSGC